MARERLQIYWKVYGRNKRSMVLDLHSVEGRQRLFQLVPGAQVLVESFVPGRAGVTPLGYVGSIADFADVDALRQRIRRARRLGFEGAFCIHPSQVSVLNEEFAPTAEEVASARELVLEYQRQVAAGHAAFRYKDRMVDLPIVTRAQQVLKQHADIVSAVKHAT